MTYRDVERTLVDWFEGQGAIVEQREHEWWLYKSDGYYSLSELALAIVQVGALGETAPAPRIENGETK